MPKVKFIQIDNTSDEDISPKNQHKFANLVEDDSSFGMHSPKGSIEDRTAIVSPISLRHRRRMNPVQVAKRQQEVKRIKEVERISKKIMAPAMLDSRTFFLHSQKSQRMKENFKSQSMFRLTC